MVYHDLARQAVLWLTGSVFTFCAFWALFKPRSLASLLGYELGTPNARSEFHAIYVGVFLAQAVLCLVAAIDVTKVVLGDLVALFVLSQPLGRLVALLRDGAPQGQLRLLTLMEIGGGILLLLVRPDFAS